MSYIVDRRLNGRHKSAVNRQRFLRRYREHIREAVNDAVNKRSIRDMERGEKISIPRGDISEPVFHHGQGGKRTIVHPGNKEFHQGDTIPRPPGGQGGGDPQASDQGEGDDDFSFQIDTQEFLNFLFSDLALPNMVKRKLTGSDSFKMVHGGVVSEGNPNKINIVRSMRQASMRRRALGAVKRRQLRALLEEQQQLQQQTRTSEQEVRLKELASLIEKAQARLKRIPYLDTVDLRYNHQIKKSQPVSQAVMLCIMDVSGSMNQQMKDIAKRFFLLLHLFLQRNYKKTEIVFIRHHTSAKEVDEEEFFYSRETGGTIVSSALKLADEIIQKRYPPNDWNIYTAQASDGDNWNDDSPACSKLLEEKLLPKMQYFSYVEIMPRAHQALWHEYARIHGQHPELFAMQQIDNVDDIFPVFKELFKRRMEESAA